MFIPGCSRVLLQRVVQQVHSKQRTSDQKTRTVSGLSWGEHLPPIFQLNKIVNFNLMKTFCLQPEIKSFKLG